MKHFNKLTAIFLIFVFGVMCGYAWHYKAVRGGDMGLLTKDLRCSECGVSMSGVTLEIDLNKRIEKYDCPHCGHGIDIINNGISKDESKTFKEIAKDCPIQDEYENAADLCDFFYEEMSCDTSCCPFWYWKNVKL